MRLKRHLFPAAVMAVVALAIVVGPEALAQFGLGTAAQGTGIPTATNIPAIIGRILRLAVGFVGTLFLLLMLYAGFLWMTARGDTKKVDQAKQLITGAIIGVLIISSAYAITALVISAASGDTSALESGSDQTEPEINVACTSDADCGDGKTCGSADADGDRFCQ